VCSDPQVIFDGTKLLPRFTLAADEPIVVYVAVLPRPRRPYCPLPAQRTTDAVLLPRIKQAWATCIQTSTTVRLPVSMKLSALPISPALSPMFVCRPLANWPALPEPQHLTPPYTLPGSGFMRQHALLLPIINLVHAPSMSTCGVAAPMSCGKPP